jgi:hypothetical protein
MKKGKRGKLGSPQLTKARAIIRPSLEAGEIINCLKLAEEYGIGSGTFEMAVYVELARMEALEQSGVAMWTKTAREKITGSIRAHKKKLDLEFEGRVLREVRKRIERTVLPSLQEREALARRILDSHKGLMERENYRKIIACLHPDRVDEELKARYEEAFLIMTGLEKVIVKEKTVPVVSTMPQTWADLMALRRTPKTKRAVKIR